MQTQRQYSFVASLITLGVSALLVAPPLVTAQSKTNAKGLEAYSRRTSDLSSTTGEFTPGDGVRVMIWRDISVADQGSVQNLGLNDDFIIDSRGNFVLPVIGEMRAVGHTRKSLARAIEDSLRIRGIRVMSSPLIRVTILGAVNKPGSYLIEPKESLWSLIGKAGGPSSDVDVKKMYVERSGQVVINNLLESFERGHSLEQLGVRSGDQIYLPAVSRFNLRNIVDYVTLTASVVLLYFQLKDRTQ